MTISTAPWWIVIWMNKSILILYLQPMSLFPHIKRIYKFADFHIFPLLSLTLNIMSCSHTTRLRPKLFIYSLSLLKLIMYYWVNYVKGSGPQWAGASSFTRFLYHTRRHTTVGRTPLDEWSARHKDLYLTTHNTHNRHTSMPPVGFEPTISACDRPQTYALDRAATDTGNTYNNIRIFFAHTHIFIVYYVSHNKYRPIPVAARSKA